MNAFSKAFGAASLGFFALTNSAWAVGCGGLNEPPCAAPEPSSWMLVGLAVVGAVVAAKFFKR